MEFFCLLWICTLLFYSWSTASGNQATIPVHKYLFWRLAVYLFIYLFIFYSASILHQIYKTCRYLQSFIPRSFHQNCFFSVRIPLSASLHTFHCRRSNWLESLRRDWGQDALLRCLCGWLSFWSSRSSVPSCYPDGCLCTAWRRSTTRKLKM